jgi:Pex2 / Pex12 amino terminal region
MPPVQVLSQRRPWVYRLLAYEDEVFALVAAILDHGSLASAGGTFSESLYGLRRAPAKSGSAGAGTSSEAAAAGQSQSGAAAPMLTQRQRRLALLLSVSCNS